MVWLIVGIVGLILWADRRRAEAEKRKPPRWRAWTREDARRVIGGLPE